MYRHCSHMGADALLLIQRVSLLKRALGVLCDQTAAETLLKV